MISMPQIQSIRRLRRNGETVASIARKTGVSEPTVRKYLREEDLSEKPPVRKRRASVMDQWMPLVEQWLAEDGASWRKQRHTATRVWERLRDEHGADVSLSTVTRAVARVRRGQACDPADAFMDLVWHPGEAQADFGEAGVMYRGAAQRMHHFVLDFPYPDIGLAQLMPGENAECTCQALQNLSGWLGGVPERIVSGQRRGRGAQGQRRRELDPPVPSVPGALRVRQLPVQPVLGPREGRGRGEGRHGAPQAVRAQAGRMEPGQLQQGPARPLPGARRETPLRQGQRRGEPVRRGPGRAAAAPRETVRRGRVEAHEDGQAGHGRARGTPPVLRRRVERAPRGDRGAARARGPGFSTRRATTW